MIFNLLETDSKQDTSKEETGGQKKTWTRFKNQPWETNVWAEAPKTTLRTLQLQIMREQAACPTARVRVTAAGASARPHATCQQVLWTQALFNTFFGCAPEMDFQTCFVCLQPTEGRQGGWASMVCGEVVVVRHSCMLEMWIRKSCDGFGLNRE